ncbi:hypothetical protein BACFIN_05873 [Bacteroides finegoldii DSM 17565]|nr:hypothetical protein BACFIN_05873 [Bacteroides finegoldii DSM 17565]
MATKVGKNGEKYLFLHYFQRIFTKKKIVFMRLFRETVYFCDTLLTKKIKGL